MRAQVLPYRLGTQLPTGFPFLVWLQRSAVPTLALGGNPAAWDRTGERKVAA